MPPSNKLSNSGSRHAFDSSSAAVAMMGQGKALSAEAGMAAASQAAMQSKLRAQQKHQEDLRAAALTQPQQRTQAQVELLCDFLSSSHLLKNLQPTNIKDLAQSMKGRAFADGELIYRQNDAAQHFYVVLMGEVVMYETDSSSVNGSSGNDALNQAVDSPAAAAAASNISKYKNAGAAAAIAPSPRSARSADRSGGGGSVPSDTVEVRRVGRREAFGEDDITAGSKREQSAVAGDANGSTFAKASCNMISSTAGGASAAASSSASATSGENVQGLLDARRRTTKASQGGAAPAAAAAASVPAERTVLLQLSADDYGAVLEGRLSTMLEQKVSFLSELPALKGLSSAYLRSLSHCFHQVQFEPREVLVRQGDASDCMYVLKSGQVCVLIDPNMTLTESGAGPGGAAAAAGNAGQSGASGGGDIEVDTKKLVQVCLLGTGSIIGDMSVREGAGGPPRRSATVVALTELMTYKVPLKEFKRRMPADVLEGMRHVANQKLVMNERQASSRTAAAAAGKDGHIVLGGAAVPEGVLRGKGLRALLESQQGHVPVGGLIDALEMYFGTGPSGQTVRRPPGGKAAEVEEYVASLSRNGFITAPPQEFLALLTDWHSPREAMHVTPSDRKVPMNREFPLPLHKHATNLGEQLPAPASVPSPSGNPLSSSCITDLAPGGNGTASPIRLSPGKVVSPHTTWGKSLLQTAPQVHVQTHLAAKQLPGSALQTQQPAGLAPGSDPPAAVPISAFAVPTPGLGLLIPQQPASAAAGIQSHALNSPLSSCCSPAGLLSPAAAASPRTHEGQQQLPVSSTRAFRDTLDQLVQHKQQQQQLQANSSGDAAAGKVRGQTAAIVREAALQLPASSASNSTAFGNNQSHFLGPSRGGGFRGNLQKPTLTPRSELTTASSAPAPIAAPAPAPPGALQGVKAAAAAATSRGCMCGSSTPEPTLHEAAVKASMLFRPGSPICITSGQASMKGSGRATPIRCVGSRSSSPSRHVPEGSIGSQGEQAGRSRTPLPPGRAATPVDGAAAAAGTSATMAVLDSFGANMVLNQKGEVELDYHGGVDLQPAQPGKVGHLGRA